MAGLSNACYRVAATDKPTLLYRKFECLIIDKKVEALIFKVASEQGLGPKLLYQCEDFRIEEFLDGRPLTIWEMRNPCFITAYANKIFDWHTNKSLRESMESFRPLDINVLVIDTAINEWAPKLKERLPSMRGKLLQDNGIPHPNLLKAIDGIDRQCLFQGYQAYYRSLVIRD
jgi:hypothetical protein